MNNRDTDFFEKHFSSAIRKLFAIPGVLQIGYGLKETAGEILPEYVLRVYVNVKKSPEELDANAMIPASIEGIRTDVHTMVPVEITSCFFTSKARAGEKLTLFLDYSGFSQKYSNGTITCLVRKDNKKYALSCGHVYSDSIRDAPYIGEGNYIYIPDTCGCECLNIECRDKAGDVDKKGILTDPIDPNSAANFTFNGKKYEIDCGLALLKSEVSFNNNIPDVGLIKRQLKDFTTEVNPVTNLPNSVIKVRKHGATTGFTNGIITELCIVKNPATDTIWVMKIKPDPGKAFKEIHEIDPKWKTKPAEIISLFAGMPVTAKMANPGDPSSRKMIFEGTIFVNHGDSGSAIVDSNLQVGGILHKGIFIHIQTTKGPVSIPAGLGVACYILPVFSFLGLDVNTAILQPGDPIAGQTIDMSNESDTPDQGDLLKLEKAIYNTAKGKAMLEEFTSHGSELIALVHHNRKVKFCWHTNKCPQFVTSYVNTARKGFDVPFKKTIGEVSLSTSYKNLYAVLISEGSTSLQESLALYQPVISDIINNCICVEDILTAFMNEEETEIQLKENYES